MQMSLLPKALMLLVVAVQAAAVTPHARFRAVMAHTSGAKVKAKAGEYDPWDAWKIIQNEDGSLKTDEDSEISVVDECKNMFGRKENDAGKDEENDADVWETERCRAVLALDALSGIASKEDGEFIHPVFDALDIDDKTGGEDGVVERVLKDIQIYHSNSISQGRTAIQGETYYNQIKETLEILSEKAGEQEIIGFLEEDVIKAVVKAKKLFQVDEPVFTTSGPSSNTPRPRAASAIPAAISSSSRPNTSLAAPATPEDLTMAQLSGMFDKKFKAKRDTMMKDLECMQQLFQSQVSQDWELSETCKAVVFLHFVGETLYNNVWAALEEFNPSKVNILENLFHYLKSVVDQDQAGLTTFQKDSFKGIQTELKKLDGLLPQLQEAGLSEAMSRTVENVYG